MFDKVLKVVGAVAVVLFLIIAIYGMQRTKPEITWSGAKIAVGIGGTTNGKVVFMPDIELGLRSDGVIVFRDTTKQSIEGEEK